MRRILLAISASAALATSPAGAQDPGCGDGYAAADEACDDGNLQDGDGCSALCRLETPAPASQALAPATPLPTDTPAGTARVPAAWPWLRVPVNEYQARNKPPRSPGKALLLSLGLTVGAAAIFATLPEVSDRTSDLEAPVSPAFVVGSAGVLALSVAPSAGHLYVGEYRHAAILSGLRLASNTAIIAGAVTVIVSALEADSGSPGKILGGLGLAVLGSIGTSVCTVVDIVDAPLAAKRHNQKRAALPTLQTTASGDLAAGVSLHTRF